MSKDFWGVQWQAAWVWDSQTPRPIAGTFPWRINYAPFWGLLKVHYWPQLAQVYAGKHAGVAAKKTNDK